MRAVFGFEERVGREEEADLDVEAAPAGFGDLERGGVDDCVFSARVGVRGVLWVFMMGKGFAGVGEGIGDGGLTACGVCVGVVDFELYFF